MRRDSDSRGLAEAWWVARRSCRRSSSGRLDSSALVSTTSTMRRSVGLTTMSIQLNSARAFCVAHTHASSTMTLLHVIHFETTWP